MQVRSKINQIARSLGALSGALLIIWYVYEFMEPYQIGLWRFETLVSHIEPWLRALQGLFIFSVVATLSSLSSKKPVDIDAFHARVWAKLEKGKKLTEQESKFLDGIGINNYIGADGVDTGIGNFGVENCEAALPVLNGLGLGKVNEILMQALAHYKVNASKTTQSTQAETDEYFAKCESFENALNEAGLGEIRERLKNWLINPEHYGSTSA